MLKCIHFKARSRDPETCARVERVVSYIVQELGIPDVLVETVQQICGILDVNCFEVN